jgi:hypothetical protein
MSKQSKAKERQCYVPKAIPSTCATCAHFTSVIEKRKGWYGTHQHEGNLRCAKGGFAVKKLGTCNEYERKEQSK